MLTPYSNVIDFIQLLTVTSCIHLSLGAGHISPLPMGYGGVIKSALKQHLPRGGPDQPMPPEKLYEHRLFHGSWLAKRNRQLARRKRAIT